MDNIMIYGIGLPRTGTRTLGSALQILGFSGSHFCVLSPIIKKVGDSSYRVNNGFYEILEALECFEINTDDFYIFTDREEDEWGDSIREREYKGPFIREYKENMKRKFKKYPNNFLIFNVSHGWPPLCDFLGVPIPKEDFPYIQ